MIATENDQKRFVTDIDRNIKHKLSPCQANCVGMSEIKTRRFILIFATRLIFVYAQLFYFKGKVMQPAGNSQYPWTNTVINSFVNEMCVPDQ